MISLRYEAGKKEIYVCDDGKRSEVKQLCEDYGVHFVVRADNTDAKMQTMKEAFAAVPDKNTEWLGYNKFFESNIRQTSE